MVSCLASLVGNLSLGKCKLSVVYCDFQRYPTLAVLPKGRNNKMNIQHLHFFSLSRRLFIVVPLLPLFFCPHPAPSILRWCTACVFSRHFGKISVECAALGLGVWKQTCFNLSCLVFFVSVRQLQEPLRASNSINTLCSGGLIMQVLQPESQSPVLLPESLGWRGGDE